jgi:hypothetical protein
MKQTGRVVTRDKSTASWLAEGTSIQSQPSPLRRGQGRRAPVCEAQTIVPHSAGRRVLTAGRCMRVKYLEVHNGCQPLCPKRLAGAGCGACGGVRRGPGPPCRASQSRVWTWPSTTAWAQPAAHGSSPVSRSARRCKPAAQYCGAAGHVPCRCAACPRATTSIPLPSLSLAFVPSTSRTGPRSAGVCADTAAAVCCAQMLSTVRCVCAQRGLLVEPALPCRRPSRLAALTHSVQMPRLTHCSPRHCLLHASSCFTLHRWVNSPTRLSQAAHPMGVGSAAPRLFCSGYRMHVIGTCAALYTDRCTFEDALA